MPRLSVWALRGALLSLLTGFTLGALMLANKGQPFWPQAWSLLPAHIEFLLVGWMAQLVFVLRRHHAHIRNHPEEGDIERALLRMAVLANQPGTVFGWLLVASALLLWSAGAAFFLNTWPRIKEK